MSAGTKVRDKLAGTISSLMTGLRRTTVSLGMIFIQTGASRRYRRRWGAVWGPRSASPNPDFRTCPRPGWHATNKQCPETRRANDAPVHCPARGYDTLAPWTARLLPRGREPHGIIFLLRGLPSLRDCGIRDDNSCCALTFGLTQLPTSQLACYRVSHNTPPSILQNCQPRDSNSCLH